MTTPSISVIASSPQKSTAQNSDISPKNLTVDTSRMNPKRRASTSTLSAASDSELSALASDDDAPKTASTDAPPRRPGAPRGPRVPATPPVLQVLPWDTSACLPTEFIYRRFHIREFVLRFRGLLTGFDKDQKSGLRVLKSLDDMAEFWGGAVYDAHGNPKAANDINLRLVLAGMLGWLDYELNGLEKSKLGVYGSLTKGKKSISLLTRAKKEARIANPEHTWKCWRTTQSLLRLENADDDDEGEDEASMADISRATSTAPSMSVDGSSDLSSLDDEMQVDRPPPTPTDGETVTAIEKLEVLEGLIELLLRGDYIREEMNEGIDKERQERHELATKKTEENKSWSKIKEELQCRCPMPPADGVALEDAEKEMPEWQEEFDEKEAEHKQRITEISCEAHACHRQLRSTTLIGHDAFSNEYHLLSTPPGAFPPSEDHDFLTTPSWLILIHGPGLSQLPITEKPAKKRKSSNASDISTSPTVAKSPREEGDEWYAVAHTEVVNLVHFIEYSHRLAKWQVKENGETQLRVQDSITELTGVIKGFADFVEFTKEAVHKPKKRAL